MADATRDADVRELIDWDEATYLADFEPPNPSIIVRGILDHPMDVELEPKDGAAGQPEYWPIEVVGYHGEIVAQVETPYSLQRSLSQLQTGSRGIELLGRSRTERIDIPG